MTFLYLATSGRKDIDLCPSHQQDSAVIEYTDLFKELMRPRKMPDSPDGPVFFHPVHRKRSSRHHIIGHDDIQQVALV